MKQFLNLKVVKNYRVYQQYVKLALTEKKFTVRRKIIYFPAF